MRLSKHIGSQLLNCCPLQAVVPASDGKFGVMKRNLPANAARTANSPAKAMSESSDL
jgi:hypothetical protein